MDRDMFQLNAMIEKDFQREGEVDKECSCQKTNKITELDFWIFWV